MQKTVLCLLSKPISRIQQAHQGIVGFLVGEKLGEPLVHHQGLRLPDNARRAVFIASASSTGRIRTPMRWAFSRFAAQAAMNFCSMFFSFLFCNKLSFRGISARPCALSFPPLYPFPGQITSRQAGQKFQMGFKLPREVTFEINKVHTAGRLALKPPHFTQTCFLRRCPIFLLQYTQN